MVNKNLSHSWKFSKCISLFQKFTYSFIIKLLYIFFYSDNNINTNYKKLLSDIKTKIEKENLYTANSKVDYLFKVTINGDSCGNQAKTICVQVWRFEMKRGYLLKKIKSSISYYIYYSIFQIIPPVLRIDLCSLGTPSWSDKLTYSDKYDQSLAWFLLALKSLLRRSFASCMLSIPTHLFQVSTFNTNKQNFLVQFKTFSIYVTGIM